MKKNYEEIEQICAKCENAKAIFDPDNVLCKIHGVVDAGYKCRKFIYDPLKRIPTKSVNPIALEYVDIDSDEE